MKKISKKEIRVIVENAVNQALSNMAISTPTTKTKKVIGKASKKVTKEVKRVMKKQTKKTAKLAKALKKNGKVSKKELSSQKIAVA